MERNISNAGILTDAEIIEKVLEGQSSLFEVLMRRYNPCLYRIARGYHFNHQDAEDLIQETHVSAYLQLHKIKSRPQYKAWLSKILIHKCTYKQTHGYYKREKPDSNFVDGSIPLLHSPGYSSSAEQGVCHKELSTILEKVLRELPTHYRAVFILREIEGFSTEQTAALMNTTTSNVKVRLNRTKVMLRKRLSSQHVPQLYELNLIYCDAIVQRVFRRLTGKMMQRPQSSEWGGGPGLHLV